ncbi:tRNA (N6-isopentenyl adenosine(37)-C2)-methylthiotransferase MiaB [Patescibacteria group bacterium]|nr:tRNA (N6-isopentenyl adenosine(37)-C2)-methylthiotransferase MiaB [Patescibacteria group bacterium]
MTKKYYLWALGCQMNKADAEKVSTILDDLGYQKTADESKADLIITLACSVRQSAIDRIYGRAKIWNRLKQKKPVATALTGCILPGDRQKMAEFFDLIFNIDDLPKLAEMLGEKGSLSLVNYLNINPKYTNNFQAHVPISNGCNNYCSYCVVPYVRGPETSRPSNKIIDECQKLIDSGYKEITLLGQNVNSYGHDLKNDLRFPQLLKKINDLPGDFWLRFITSHPKDMSDELIEVIAQGEKICEYIHLPVQSGDDEILKKMNRHYSREYYLKLIEKIRNKIPGVSISTDVIAGFPGETKKQFKNTAKLFKQVKFDMAYIAQYSPRAGTAAYQLKDDVPKVEKQKREMKLNEILKKTALKHNKKLIGKTTEILVDESKNNYLIGKTKTFKKVRFENNTAADSQAISYDFIDKFVKIKITKAKAFGLEGILITA